MTLTPGFQLQCFRQHLVRKEAPPHPRTSCRKFVCTGAIRWLRIVFQGPTALASHAAPHCRDAGDSPFLKPQKPRPMIVEKRVDVKDQLLSQMEE